MKGDCKNYFGPCSNIGYDAVSPEESRAVSKTTTLSPFQEPALRSSVTLLSIKNRLFNIFSSYQSTERAKTLKFKHTQCCNTEDPKKHQNHRIGQIKNKSIIKTHKASISFLTNSALSIPLLISPSSVRDELETKAL